MRQYHQVTGGRQVYVSAGKSPANPLQLVSWKSDDGVGRRMIVNLGQVTKTLILSAPANPPTPWAGVANTANYQAPDIGKPQVRIQWGAGGVRQQTTLPWPVTGGSFALTADAIDIDVFSNSAFFNSASDQPAFQAWVMPGDSPANEVQFRSNANQITQAPSSTASFAVVGSYLKSFTIDTNDIPASIPSNLLFIQQSTGVDGLALLTLKATQLSQALKNNSIIEIPADPSCSQYLINNIDASIIGHINVTENYNIA